MQANGYRGPRALSPGQQLIIPHASASVATAPALAAPVSKPIAVASAGPSVHVVNHGDTLLSIARRNHVPVAELAKANNLEPSAKLKLGMKLTVPGAKTAAAAPAAQPVAVAAAQPAAASRRPRPKWPRRPAVRQQTARLAQATDQDRGRAAAETPVKASEATGALPTFRWPVRGKVITELWRQDQRQGQRRHQPGGARRHAGQGGRGRRRRLFGQ